METAIRNTTLQDKDFWGFWILDFRFWIGFFRKIAEISRTIAALFFSEVAREGGKSLETGVFQTTTQLVMAVKHKFKTSGTEVILARAEKRPTEANVDRVKAELAAQREEDTGFATDTKVK